MPAGLVVKVNNFGFNLTFTVLDSTSTPLKPQVYDLTGLFVTLYVYTQEQQPALLFSGSCTVMLPATNGICVYPVVAGNFPTLGTYDAELELTDTPPPIPPNNIELDTETFSINVIKRHP